MGMHVDYHLHTNNTEDGSNTLLEIAERAASLGLQEIAITDHYIPGFIGYCVGPREIERHFRDAELARERFGITVRVGIEADFIPAHAADTERFFKSLDFDFIMGGAHIVNGYGLASEDSAREYFKAYDPLEGYRIYFRQLIETIETGLFDVMAHLDIVRKFGAGVPVEPRFEEYEREALDVARALVRTGTGFEVNCRGFDHAPGEQYPSRRFLELLREQGADNTVTMGSDAHWLDAIGTFLDRGVRVLRDTGFRHINVFKGRVAERAPIAE